MKPFKHNVMKRHCLDTKKSRDYEYLVTCTVLIVHVPVIPHGRPRNVRDAHHLWAERKAILRLKSDEFVPSPILVYSLHTPALTTRGSWLVPLISQSV